MAQPPLDPVSWASLIGAAEFIRSFSAPGSVTIWGHDDLDGVASVAILLKALQSIGVKAGYFIPPRTSAHYGLDSEIIRDLSRKGTRLLITVDSGISNWPEVAEAKELSIRVVVTDHHELPDKLPEADCLINPKLNEDPKPTSQLAGCGVAFYMSAALQGFSGEGWMDRDRQALAWASLGTVSDRVPLEGENRLIVSAGLTALAEDRAISETAEIAGFDISSGLSPLILRHTLVPLLGQVESEGFSHPTLDLLMGKVDAPWVKLTRFKMSERQAELERQMERLRQILDPSLPYALAIDSSIKPALAGTLASRLRDETGGPAVVVTRRAGLWAGECRSYLPFDCFEFLSSMSNLFAQYGGHRQAAGFTVAPGAEDDFMKQVRVEMERRRGLMSNISNGNAPKYTFLHPSEVLDIREELSAAAPFGPGNPMPRVTIQNLNLPREEPYWPLSRFLDCQVVKGASPIQAYIDITHKGEVIIANANVF